MTKGPYKVAGRSSMLEKDAEFELDVQIAYRDPEKELAEKKKRRSGKNFRNYDRFRRAASFEQKRQVESLINVLRHAGFCKMQSSVCFFVLLMRINALHLTKKRVSKRLNRQLLLEFLI